VTEFMAELKSTSLQHDVLVPFYVT